MDHSLPSAFNSESIEAAKLGDRRAMRVVYDEHVGAVAGYALAKGVDDPEATANEVLYRVLREMSKFSGSPERFRSWVFTIAHNLIVDDLRRSARRPRTRELDPSAPLAPAPAAEDVALLAIEANHNYLAGRARRSPRCHD